MVSLFTDLRIEWDPDARDWVLLDALEYHHARGVIVVPEGFHTDLDSVPRVPGAYLLFKGRSMRAPVVHDWLYWSQSGRDYADAVFLDAMRDLGVPAWQRYPIYWAVRACGAERYHDAYR